MRVAEVLEKLAAQGLAGWATHEHVGMVEGTGVWLGDGEQADGDGDEDRDEETTHDGTVGWKEKWIRQLSFALARGVAGLIIRRAVGRCPAGVGWRWAGGGRVREGMGPNPDRGEAAQLEGVERLALMDRAWEDAIEEIDYATQDGSGGGTQGSGGTQDEQSEQASGGADEAGAMAPRLLESMEDVRREAEHLSSGRGQGGGTAEAQSGEAHAGAGGPGQAAASVQDILAEWDDLSSPGPEGGVWTQERSGTSPEQAMALAEGGVATLMGVNRRVAGLLEGTVGRGGTVEGDNGDVDRHVGGVDTRRAPQSPGAHPGSDDHLQQVARQHTASHQLLGPLVEVAGRAGTNGMSGDGPQVGTAQSNSGGMQFGSGRARSGGNNVVFHSQPLGIALGNMTHLMGGQDAPRPGFGIGREQGGDAERRIRGGSMASATQRVDVNGSQWQSNKAVSAEMLKKVEELCGILPLLNKLGHAQAQGLLLRFCAHPRLGFWLRGVPPEMMREAAEEHDRRMQGALRDLLPGGGLAWHSCEFATLPHGMGLTKAARKVSEAMEVIGEARGANEHLPRQVPEADDVKKLSDYSRFQKRAQRVYAAVLHSADWLWLAGHVGASRLPWLFSVTFNSIGPAFLRGVPCCPVLELSSAEYRVALRHILHAE
ncbi:hypothetical protein CYMTET_31649 [Cymbomonas tetramitiformis]|uniref:Uncharacterized protein n=1 Tax=Cymbomonas tetramitiformis TaxID=36881 RepID=A0AAE0KSY8_9CHLO|nr:hypothetical protein CYMTET_31649 [Cymbomonas tetramitiformis]